MLHLNHTAVTCYRLHNWEGSKAALHFSLSLSLSLSLCLSSVFVFVLVESFNYLLRVFTKGLAISTEFYGSGVVQEYYLKCSKLNPRHLDGSLNSKTRSSQVQEIIKNAAMTLE